MNVYDFDKTIYNGDSTVDFYIYCIKISPRLLIFLPGQILALLKYIFKIHSKTEFKEQFFAFLNGIKNIDDYVFNFWTKHDKKIASWYVSQKESTDVVISASPEFLLKPITQKLGIDLIASLVCSKTGKYTGLNCYGEEKVKRFLKKYPDAVIQNFYSDSHSDEHMSKIAKKSYLVTNGKINNWK